MFFSGCLLVQTHDFVVSSGSAEDALGLAPELGSSGFALHERGGRGGAAGAVVAPGLSRQLGRHAAVEHRLQRGQQHNTERETGGPGVGADSVLGRALRGGEPGPVEQPLQPAGGAGLVAAQRGVGGPGVRSVHTHPARLCPNH